MERKRILVITDGQGAAEMRSILRHARQRRWDWEPIGIDLADLGLNDPGRGLAAWAGVMGWIAGRPLPSWAAGLPRVLWRSSGPAEPGEVLFIPDDAAIGALAARHLRDQGVAAAAVVREARHPIRSHRYAAFLETAAALGLPALRYHPPAGLDRAGELAVFAAWVRAAPRPLGVFLHQDRDALALLRECRAIGLSVPDDLRVIGVDDIPAAAAASPALSSVAFPIPLMAKRMAEAMQGLLHGGDPGGRVEVVAPLRVAARASTAHRAGSDPAIDRVRRRIDADPAQAPGAAAEAGWAGLSRAQYHRRFRAACGCTPRAYRRRARLRLAQDLLLARRGGLDAIARRCGWGCPEALWKAFRAAGLPAPGAWRAALAEGDA